MLYILCWPPPTEEAGDVIEEHSPDEDSPDEDSPDEDSAEQYKRDDTFFKLFLQ